MPKAPKRKGPRAQAERLRKKSLFGANGWTWALAIAATLLGILLASKLIEPPPPARIVLATGAPAGAYHAFGERYREALEARGLEVELRQTAGAMENLWLLARGEVDVAFVQGGTVGLATDIDRDALGALASVFYEPLWVFHRDAAAQRLSDLKGRRIAVGAEGSGTRAVAQTLLDLAGVGPDEATRLAFPPADAARALRAGEIDAAFFVAAPDAPYVQALGRDPDLRLLHIRRAKAWERQLRHLSRIELGEGLLDLAENVPSADTTLLAPTATLVARADLHPGPVQLLLETARSIHHGGGLLEPPGAFPSARYLDPQLEMHPVAARYFDSGPSLLYRYLPLWLITLFSRLGIFLLPMLTLLFPLLRWAPSLYQWGMNDRIYRWYKVLREIEDGLQASPGDRADLEAAEDRLRALAVEVSEVTLSYYYMRDVYALRMHIELVTRQVADRLTALQAPASPDPRGGVAAREARTDGSKGGGGVAESAKTG
jgi:uncharacterized protein